MPFIRKALLFIVFMLLLSMIVFALAHLSPHDPLLAYYGERVEKMNEAQRAAAMARLSLDKPVAMQYLTWLHNALRGDFGISYKYKQPVSSLIAKLWRNTAALGGFSYILTFLFAAILGIFCAKREGKPIDRLICKLGTATSVIPSFFIALIFILVFAVNLKILPTSGAYSLRGDGGLWDRAAHLVLPVSVLCLSHLWYYAYMIRNRVIEELSKDYTLLLRVKRVSERRILYRHCLRNALPTFVTIMAISAPHIIAGTYIVETVFSYPGLGALTFESAKYRDYNMLMVLTLLTGAVMLIFSVASEMLAEWLDPRMKAEDIVKNEE